MDKRPVVEVQRCCLLILHNSRLIDGCAKSHKLNPICSRLPTGGSDPGATQIGQDRPYHSVVFVVFNVIPGRCQLTPTHTLGYHCDLPSAELGTAVTHDR